MKRRFIHFAAGVVLVAFAIATTVHPMGAANAPRSNSCRNGYVGLTFDDGPNPNTRPAIIDALHAARARATFFEIGSNAQKNPELVRATLRAGMWIGNHTLSHPHLSQVDQSTAFAEIASTQFVLQEITGRRPELFRPPFGENTEEGRRDVADSKLLEVLWNVDSRDWDGKSAADVRAAASALKAGEIILMHDGNQASLEALPQILDDLANRGLCAGRIAFTPRDIRGVSTVFHAVAVKP